MSTGNCKDCRHWTGNKSKRWNKRDPAYCDGIKHHSDMLAFINGDHANLVTSADFGCVLFSALEPEVKPGV
jgi:TPP-dependent indolepyruvate ferredoxin oxidoreductase alpha subunit